MGVWALNLYVVYGAMLVVLATMLFQVKARIYMAKAAGKTLTLGQQFVRYLGVTLVWAAITAGVVYFALTR